MELEIEKKKTRTQTKPSPAAHPVRPTLLSRSARPALSISARARPRPQQPRARLPASQRARSSATRSSSRTPAAHPSPPGRLASHHTRPACALGRSHPHTSAQPSARFHLSCTAHAAACLRPLARVPPLTRWYHAPTPSSPFLSSSAR